MDTSWLYSSDIDPLNYEGFVYLITNTLTGRAYVGRKYIYITRKGKITGESNWRDYWGTSKDLSADIDLLGKDKFKREILHFCATRAQANYLEVEEQFKRDVLTALLPDGARAYYNANIMSRYYVRSVESYKCSGPKISAAMKKWMERNDHPMKGKVHPNKGKKINSGHNKCKGRIVITDGVKTRRIKPGVPVPAGWRLGMTTKPRKPHPDRLAYEAAPAPCAICAGPIPFENRNANVHCSRKCAGVEQSRARKGFVVKLSDDSKQKALDTKKAKLALKYGFDTYDALKAEVVRLHDAGTKVTHIAMQLGTSVCFVRNILAAL